MTKVQFSIPGNLDAALAARVPIEILDHDLIPVGRRLAGEPIELPAGHFAARTVLPDGQRLVTAFELDGAQDSRSIELRIPGSPSPAAQARDSGRTEFFTRTRPLFEIDALDVGDEALAQVPTLRVRLLSGCPLTESLDAGPWQTLAIGEELEIRGGDKPQLVEIEELALLIVVPVIDGDTRVMAVIEGEDGGPAPHMKFRNPDLEIMLRYIGSGLCAQVQQLVGSDAALAENALASAERRPIASAAGAYAILRAGDIGRLRTWVSAFAKRYPEVADAWIISAELLGRAGEHVAVLRMLGRLGAGRLPFLGAGLSYAVDRLRQYRTMAAAGHLDVDPETAKSLFEELLPRLLWISMRTDYERPLLSFAPPVAPPHASWFRAAAIATVGAAAAVGVALHLRHRIAYRETS